MDDDSDLPRPGEGEALVFVPLLDEGVNVMRPVLAVQEGSGYRLPASAPAGEKWSVPPGTLALCEERGGDLFAQRRLWTQEELEPLVRRAAEEVCRADDPEEPAMELWRLGFTRDSDWHLPGGLWPIWGAITDNWTHPAATVEDQDRAAGEARASAKDLLASLGSEEAEVEYCWSWLSRLGIGERPDSG